MVDYNSEFSEKTLGRLGLMSGIIGREHRCDKHADGQTHNC